MAKVIMFEPGLGALDRRVDEVRHNVAEDVRDDARRYAPVDTGAMIATIRHVHHTRTADRVYVGTNHWMFPEYGTRPHIILPKKKQALHWPTARHPVKVVHHPGTPQQSFMRRALYQRRILRRF